MSTPKRGRPALPPSQRHDVRLPVQVTRTERETLESAAAAQGLTASEYVRRAVAYCAATGVPLRHVTTGPLPPRVPLEDDVPPRPVPGCDVVLWRTHD